MAFQMCQNVTFKGTEYLQGVDAVKPLELDNVEITESVCGGKFESADEAIVSFKAEMQEAASRHFRFHFRTFSPIAIEDVIPDSQGPELRQVKTFCDYMKAFIIGMGENPYAVLD